VAVWQAETVARQISAWSLTTRLGAAFGIS